MNILCECALRINMLMGKTGSKYQSTNFYKQKNLTSSKINRNGSKLMPSGQCGEAVHML